MHSLNNVLVVRKPQQLQPYLNLSSPFAAPLWVAIIVAYFAAEILYAGLRYLRLGGDGGGRGQAFLPMFGVLCSQGESYTCVVKARHFLRLIINCPKRN